jgi:hypothetical protein
MMIQKKLLNISVFVLILLLASCTKEAGEGGTSAIKGKVYTKYYNNTFTSLIGESYAPDKDVYIIYGDDVTYGDKQKTCYDGSFEFKYLRKGNYKVYAYSLDTTLTNPATQFAVIAEVTISNNGETVTSNDLIIIDNQ